MQYYTAGVYDAKGEWIPSHGQRCKCGLCFLGEDCGYCSVVVALPKAAKDVTRESMREDAEIRLGKSRDEARARATEHIPRSAPSPVKAKQSKPSRAPRRTPEEMAAARAKKEQELAAIAARVTPAWLATEDPATEAILAGTDVEEAMVKDVSSEIAALLAGEDVE